MGVESAMATGVNQQVFTLFREIIIAGLTGRRMDPTYNLLAPHEGFLLEIIAAHQPISMKELSASTGTLPNTMTGVVDRLVRQGYLARQSSPDDRRIVLISLTEHGQELHLQSQKFYLNYAERLLGTLTAEDKRTLLTLLKRIAIPSQS